MKAQEALAAALREATQKRWVNDRHQFGLELNDIAADALAALPPGWRLVHEAALGVNYDYEIIWPDENGSQNG